MANSDGGVELNLRVNTETGELDTLGGKFTKAAGGAKQAEDAFKGLGGEAKNLMAALLPIVGAVEIVKFFADAVKGAEEQNESLRRLNGTLSTNGQAWKDGGAAVRDWADGIAAATRFSDSEALSSLEKLARSTTTVTQAQAASKLAMDLSVSSGKSLGESTDFVNNLINKQERAITQAHKEFGTYTEKAQTAQEVLDALSSKVGGAAEREESLTKSSHQLSSAFEQFKDVIGNAFAPALTGIISVLTAVIKRFDEFGTAVAASLMVAFEAIKGYNQAIAQALTGHFKQALETIHNTSNEIKNIVIAGVQDVVESEAKKAEVLKQHANERINTTRRMTDAEIAAAKDAADKEADADTKRYQHWAQLREQQAQKIKQIETSIQDTILKTGDQTYAKQKQVLDNQYAYKRSVINKEINDQVAKMKLLGELETEHAAEVAALDKQNMIMKFNQSLEVADLATQTFSILNQMGDQHSQGEVNRAKAILGLEKAIAIARAISSAMAAPPGIAQAIAVAQVAMVTAQFAMQYQAIDKAQSQYKSSQSSNSAPSAGAPAPSLPTLSISDAAPSNTNFSTVSSGGGGGGGGGGGSGNGQTTINVGGIVVNFNPDKLSIDNVDVVMSRMYEKVRQGTIEGVQLAVALNNQAARNSNLAV